MKDTDHSAFYKTYLKNFPNQEGFFGDFGGSFIPEHIAEAMKEINDAYDLIASNADFINELRKIRKTFQGRPTPIYFAHNLTKKYQGAGIYLKREDLNHTGAHKLNHCMGEALLAKFMGKKKLIAETGAGQHGVALATAAAYFGLECEIHMGEVDIQKEKPNVARMKILGARVIPVSFGDKTLKEAVDSAFESYLKDSKNTMYAIGSVVGPHPFPKIVRDFQSIVGMEAREQFLELTGELPDIVTACVGGGSNAMGIFSGFIDEHVKLVGVEPLGRAPAQSLEATIHALCSKTPIQQDTPTLGEHAASLTCGSKGTMHGFHSIMLQDTQGNPANVHSIASGLDYPSVGPEHAFLHSIGRTQIAGITDKETIDAFFALSKNEGIIPAIESSHALAYALKIAPKLKGKKILINLSGRGDKDLDFVIENYGYGD